MLVKLDGLGFWRFSGLNSSFSRVSGQKRFWMPKNPKTVPESEIGI
jgi:hypothetical protein